MSVTDHVIAFLQKGDPLIYTIALVLVVRVGHYH